MSVITMARRARAAEPATRDGVRRLTEAGDGPGGGEAGGAEKSDKSLSTALDTLAGYIPGDVTAIFIFVTATLGSTGWLGVSAAMVGFLAGLFFCLFIVVTDYLLQARRGLETSLPATGWAAFSSVTGFVLWALAMPGSELNASFHGIPDSICAVLAFVWSMVLVRLSAFFEPVTAAAS